MSLVRLDRVGMFTPPRPQGPQAETGQCVASPPARRSPAKSKAQTKAQKEA